MVKRGPLVVASALLLLIVVFRTLVSGWGPPGEGAGTGSTLIGLAAHPADNLSYISWAQQASAGRWLFEILYTTTEHHRVFFNPLFLAIGKAASLAGVSPLLVLNVLAVFSLPVVVLCVSSICRTLGIGAGGTLAAVCFAIGGGGVSWVRWITERIGVSEALVGPAGPDLTYYDVYPIVAFLVAPYHALALAIVALLTLVVIRTDDPERPLGWQPLALIVGLAWLLAAARPHISIMVLAAYGTAAAATASFRLPGALLRRRAIVAACLAAAILPPFLYSVWVSQHPVWLEYSKAHPHQTHDWLIGFFFLWALAGVGVSVLGDRVLRTPFAFLAAWGFGSALALLVLNGFIYPKLTYGFTIALAVLAGAAIDAYKDRFVPRAMVPAAAVAVSIVALASPLVMIAGFAGQRPVRTSSELFQVISTIRNDSASPVPTVLTDCDTGVLLPGLGGTRVFCGHWALTDGNRPKIVLLARLGFLREGEDVPVIPGVSEADVEGRGAGLAAQIANDRFDYVVVRKRDRIYAALQNAAAGCTLQSGTHYATVKLCPAVKAVLSELTARRAGGVSRQAKS